MTIREIAQRCGVSRGTVDRVINGRGRVRPETEALVMDMLHKVGYTKNIAGRALTVRKMHPTIGVLLSSEGNPFFDEVIDGVRAAEADLADYGIRVELKTMRGYDTDTQLRLMESFSGRLTALVMQPINDGAVVRKVKAFADGGIPVVTVNSDLENSRRACYVGSDYISGGRTAAGVVRSITGGSGRLGLLTGVESILGHQQRRQAFEAHLRDTCPGIVLAQSESAGDDAEQAYRVTRRMLAKDPHLDTLMLIAAGLSGVCRAVLEAGRDRVRLFAFDSVPGTREMMRRGLLKAVICQQPYLQGYRSVRAAFDIILTGSPGPERQIMENQIKILENLADERGGPVDKARGGTL